MNLPRHRHQRVDREYAAKLDVRDEIERVRQRMRRVRRMLPRQLEAIGR